MPERDVIRSVIDFSFLVKAQLYSDETAFLRSILVIAIMEAEDLLENFNENEGCDKRENAHKANR